MFDNNENQAGSSQPGAQVTPSTTDNNSPIAPSQPGQAVPPPKSKSKKLIYLLVGLVVIVAGAAAAVLMTKKDEDKTAKNNATTQLTKVRMHMGYLHQAQFAGFYVAKEKGFYRDAGLDVDLHEFVDGEDLNKEASEDKIDFGTSTPLEVIAARDKGYKVKALAAIYQTSPYCFISPKTANIQTPADFKGKVLGYVGNNTEAQIAYPSLLSAYGISPSQVTVKTIDYDIVKDFQDHVADTADVYRTDQTYQLDKAGIAYNILQPEQFGFNIYGDVIIASDKLVKNRPNVATKFVQATLKGTQYAIDHQDEALTITAKYENEIYKDPAYEKYILKNSIPLMKPTGGQKLGNMQFVPWNRAFEAIKATGQVKPDLNVTEVYTNQFIQ